MRLGTAARYLALLLPLLVAKTARTQDDSGSLADRIRNLEKRQDEMFQQFLSESRNVGTFLNDKISFGGLLDTAISGVWGDTTKTQLSATPTALAFNLAAELEGGFRFNSQTQFAMNFPLLNPHNDPRAVDIGRPPTRQFGNFETVVTVPQAFLEYSTSPEVVIQVGRGYVPFGIAFQLRDFVLFRRRGGPQLITGTEADDVVIASSNWTGIHLSGSLRVSQGQWGYDAYTVTPNTNPRSIGGGLRAWYSPSSAVTVGASTQVGKQGGSTYTSIGTDLRLRLDRFGADAEAAVNVKTNLSDSSSYYVEPFYTFLGESVLVYGVFDYLDNPGNFTEPGMLPDPYQRWVFGGGINWLPSHFTRFRLGLLYNDYVGANASVAGQYRNYYALDLSAGVEF